MLDFIATSTASTLKIFNASDCSSKTGIGRYCYKFELSRMCPYAQTFMETSGLTNFAAHEAPLWCSEAIHCFIACAGAA